MNKTVLPIATCVGEENISITLLFFHPLSRPNFLLFGVASSCNYIAPIAAAVSFAMYFVVFLCCLICRML